jgi:hypothetical protein
MRNHGGIAATLCVLFLAVTARPDISGRAVTSAGNPLAGVIVKLSTLRLSDTTAADGLFAFRIASTSAANGRVAFVPAVSMRSGRVAFVLLNSQRVAIGLFDATGKKAATVEDRFLSKGKYDIDLRDKIGVVAAGLYVLRVSLNGASAAAKIMVAGGTINPARAEFIIGASEGIPTSAVPVLSTDTLVFSKQGYFVKRLSVLTSTTKALGDVVISQDKIAVNNASQDLYDQFLVESTAAHGLDSSVAMIIKAMIVIESGFNAQAISMWDQTLPCGTHSYGLIQVTPGCISGYATLPAGTAVTATISGGLNGVTPVLTYANPADKTAGNTIVKENNIIIDLVTNPANPLYATSAFNPAYCIDHGAAALASVIAEMKRKFPSCSSVNYVSMGLAGYNQGSGTVTGCASFNANGQAYVNSALSQYRSFCTKAGITPVY